MAESLRREFEIFPNVRDDGWRPVRSTLIGRRSNTLDPLKQEEGCYRVALFHECSTAKTETVVTTFSSADILCVGMFALIERGRELPRKARYSDFTFMVS
jgi:hypothetical protein